MNEKNEHGQMLTVAKIAIEKSLSLKKLNQKERQDTYEHHIG